MITVQWANHREMTYSGQDYMDAQWEDALASYAKKIKEWPNVRIVLGNDEEEDDWIIIKSCISGPAREDREG